MKFLKWFFISLLTLLIVASSAVYVLLTRYRQEIRSEVISTLKTEYGVNLEVGDMRVSLFSNWPQVAVQLRDVTATANKFPGSHIKASSLGLSFNIRELLNKRLIVQSLSLRDAEVVFIKSPDTLKHSGPVRQVVEKEPLTFEIRKVVLRNTHFRYLSPVQGQDIDLLINHNTVRLVNYEEGIRASLRGRVLINGMEFRTNKGRFFDNTRAKMDLFVTWFHDDKSLCIEPGSALTLNEHKYRVAGNLELGDAKKFSLIAETEKVLFRQVQKIMNPRIRRVLSNYDVAKPLNAKIILVAGIGRREEPALIVTATTEHNNIFIGTSKIPYRDISFKGKIVCVDRTGQRGDMEKAKVHFQRIHGRIYDHQFSATVLVRNLQRPYIFINGKMNIDASKIDLSLKNEFDLKGKAQAHIRYSGLAEHINREEFLGKDMHLKADLRLIDLSYKEKKRPYVYTLNGMAEVRNTDLSFENLDLQTAVANARLKGKVNNFVNYVFGFTNGFKATLTAYTDSLNLNPVMMKPKNPAPAKEEGVLVAVSGTSDPKTPGDSLQGKINALLDKNENFSSFEFDVDLQAKKMYLRRVFAEDALISLNYRNEILDIKSLKLRTCDGSIKARGIVSNFNRVSADISVEDMDVNMMFTQFENFGQEAILSDNIQGKIFIEAKFNSQLDDNLEVIGETMTGDVSLSLKNGELINFEPMQKLSNFLFKNRDFNRITFSELNESFEMRGYEMKISEFEIGSNILNLFVVNGIYNFKGESNINLLVPWSNLKKRGKNYVPQTSGESAENTRGVKLNFSGPASKMKLSLGHKDFAELKPSI